MEDRIKNILINEYKLNVEKLNCLEGGYRTDETYLIITNDKIKYVVKYIEYNHSVKYLQTILEFENILHDLYKYPCPNIIHSNNKQLFIIDNNRYLFIQTFIQGTELTKDIIEKKPIYLYKMGSLLAQLRMASIDYSLNIHLNEEEQELTDQWWNKQNFNNIDQYLLSNIIQCKEYISNLNLNLNFSRGIIHNDFHINNSIITNDDNIFIIDFVDAYQSIFICDLATSLFHLLIDDYYGEYQANIFLQGYQQIYKLTLEEKKSLQIFVQFKLTMSLIEDLRHTENLNDPFIQSCFHLLNKLKNNSNLINNLLE
ncbi:unnamed protein product [Rotaria sp. Silwood1]|nr:unnamed protein product [Rotaria sp. Silwood1]